jgi:hypothetical protein
VVATAGAAAPGLALAGGVLMGGSLTAGQITTISIVAGVTAGAIYAANNSDAKNNQSKSKSNSDSGGKTGNADPNNNLPKEKNSINISQNISNQMEKRGWTKESIQNTVDDPYTTRAAMNKANGNPATAYYNEDGSYVVTDDVTNDVVQISDQFDTNWIPDDTIVDPYIP